ncbi:fluoride efflux transporter FluC [Bacillus sp. B1-b2]|uniref:fluoride efflux transporter FluC n=1 Tax=Bacillus sp. B1-b2 TaxID=2653201 RepID=UPI00126194BF|nr:CrcB family protein [Bacillus sp. B1-b2]KAB7671134.1 CrcB family protein [Bacillus sp. B1-b2]
MVSILLIGAGGFFGAITRYYIINLLKSMWKKDFIPTILVNLSASFLLGLLANSINLSSIYTFACIGFLGAFSTFSTLVVEAWKLFNLGRKVDSLVYLALTFFGGMAFCFSGVMIGRMFF